MYNHKFIPIFLNISLINNGFMDAQNLDVTPWLTVRHYKVKVVKPSRYSRQLWNPDFHYRIQQSSLVTSSRHTDTLTICVFKLLIWDGFGENKNICFIQNCTMAGSTVPRHEQNVISPSKIWYQPQRQMRPGWIVLENYHINECTQNRQVTLEFYVNFIFYVLFKNCVINFTLLFVCGVHNIWYKNSTEYQGIVY